jgi:hypothetical protein
MPVRRAEAGALMTAWAAPPSRLAAEWEALAPPRTSPLPWWTYSRICVMGWRGPHQPGPVVEPFVVLEYLHLRAKIVTWPTV